MTPRMLIPSPHPWPLAATSRRGWFPATSRVWPPAATLAWLIDTHAGPPGSLGAEGLLRWGSTGSPVFTLRTKIVQ